MPLRKSPVRTPALLAANVSWIQVVGRLREGQSTANADAEVRVIAHQLNPPGTTADREGSARAASRVLVGVRRFVPLGRS